METAQLPFERGRSASGMGLPGLTLTDTSFAELEGKIYSVPDTVHGKGGMIRLIALKNDSGGDLTVARRFLMFTSTSAYDWRRRAKWNDTKGGVVVAMDDKYTVGATILQYDIFLAVLEGLVTVKTEATDSVSLTAGNSIISEANGLVYVDPAAAGEFVAGAIDADSNTAGEDVVIHMAGNLSMPPAAG